MSSAIAALDGGQIVLWRRSHKSDEVAETLVRAGMSPDRIAYLDPDRRKAQRKGRAAFLMQATYWLTLRSAVHFRLTARTRPFLDNIATYIALKSALHNTRTRYWVIFGDLSPHLIALCGAAREAGHATIGWQSDYLDFKYFPVPPDLAAVLNKSGVRLARRTGNTADGNDTYWQEPPEIRPLRLTIEEGRIGVLLNAFADKSIIQRLARLQQRFQRMIEVRLHPRSSLDIQAMPEGLEAAPRAEPLEAFVDRSSLLICGNTSAQLKALCRGTPIVQLAGLDDLAFDHHGYIAKGLVIGFDDDDKLSFERIEQFYKKEFRGDALRSLIGPKSENRTPPLTAMVNLLNAAT